MVRPSIVGVWFRACLAILFLLSVPCGWAQAWQTHPLLQIGQGEGPFAAAFSPDRTRVATGGRRGAFIWDVETGELLRTFPGHTGDVTAVAYSNDGSMLVTGSNDRTARLWDVNSGQQLLALVEDGDVNIVVFSPDDTLIATGDRIWDTATGELRRDHIISSPRALAFSGDGAWLLVGSDDGKIRLWDWEGNLLLRVFQGTYSNTAVAFSPDERYIATSSGDRVVLLDVNSGEAVREFTREGWGWINTVAFSPDGSRVLTGGTNEAILWDTQSGERIRTFWPYTFWPYRFNDSNGLLSAVFATDEIRTISTDGSIYIWESESGGEEMVLAGHGSGVSSVAFSPDGTRVLTGSGDNTAKLWDAQAGAEIRTFSGHTDLIRSVAFSPGGTRVLTGSGDNTAKLWDAQTGATLRTFSGHTWPVNSVAFSPDGMQVLTGSSTGSPDWRGIAKLWDAQTGAEIRTFSVPTSSSVLSVAFSPDGNRVLTGSDDSTAKLWDAQTGIELLTFLGHTDVVSSVAFSPDGTRVLTGSGGGTDRTAMLWDAQTGTVLRTFLGGANAPVSSVAFSPDGLLILVGLSSQRWAVLFDVQTGGMLRALSKESHDVTSVAYSPDGSKVLTGSSDATAIIWSMGTGGIRSRIDHTSAPIFGALSPDGSNFAIGMNYNAARFIDTQTGATRKTLQLNHTQDTLIRCALYSPDGSWLVTGGEDKKAIIHDSATGAVIRTFTGHTATVNSVALSPDGTRLLTGSDDKTARLWNIESGATVRTLSAHEGAVRGVAISPSGTQALTASADGTAKLWNLSTGFPVRQFSGSGVVPRVAYFAPDGSWILTGAEVWNPATGALIHKLEGHSGAINSAAITKDGQYILTGSSDTTTRLWSAQAGEALRVFSGHRGAINVVALAPDGSRAYTGSEDGAILSWELAPPRAIILSGGGAFTGNPIARQTHELGAYAYQTLRGRGYEADEILYLDAFPNGHPFGGGAMANWDVDGDGALDVDAPATREALQAALEGDFARGAGRLLIVMIDHGYKSGETVAFRINPTQAVLTTELDGWLNALQHAAPMDVTLLVDCCYSGRFVTDCKKRVSESDAQLGIPAARDRIVISSTSEHAEAVFLPAPDLTSFMHTFLGSAYMGNSMGEAWRSGRRFFEAFPVAGQVPRLSDGEIDTADDPTTTSTPRANHEFFGASWAYGVQADRNINSFFPVFASVTPANVTVDVGTTVTLRATLLPYQSPLAISAALRPPAPTVLSGEPITGLPRVALTKAGGTLIDGEIWEAAIGPELLAEQGPYRVTLTARFGSDRLSDPETVGFTVSNEPDPDGTRLRAVLAFGSSSNSDTNAALRDASGLAYKAYLNRFRTSIDSTTQEEWIDLWSEHGDPFDPRTARPAEVAARAALQARSAHRQYRGGVSAAAVLQSIAAFAPNADRLYVHLAADEATNGTLRLKDGELLTAQQLDAALDAVQSQAHAPQVMVTIDGAGSGSFLPLLRATSGQQRVVITSGRASDCALFLSDPGITFTHRLVGPLWGGSHTMEAFEAADGFQRGFAGNFLGTRIAPQLDDNGDGVFTPSDGALARTWFLGRRFAFAGDEASGLPFVLRAEIIPATTPGGMATLRAHVLEGIDPSLDPSVPGDVLGQYRVWAQLVPQGVVCSMGATLPRYRLRRDGPNAWSFSAQVSTALLPAGTHAIALLAEYADGAATRKTSEPVFSELATTLTPAPTTHLRLY